MTFEYRVAQIIKLFPAMLAFVSLPMSLSIVKTSFIDPAGSTFRTFYPFRPAQFTDYFETLCIIYEVLDVDHSRILSTFFHLLETGKEPKNFIQPSILACEGNFLTPIGSLVIPSATEIKILPPWQK